MQANPTDVPAEPVLAGHGSARSAQARQAVTALADAGNGLSYV